MIAWAHCDKLLATNAILSVLTVYTKFYAALAVGANQKPINFVSFQPFRSYSKKALAFLLLRLTPLILFSIQILVDICSFLWFKAPIHLVCITPNNQRGIKTFYNFRLRQYFFVRLYLILWMTEKIKWAKQSKATVYTAVIFLRLISFTLNFKWNKVWDSFLHLISGDNAQRTCIWMLWTHGVNWMGPDTTLTTNLVRLDFWII